MGQNRSGSLARTIDWAWTQTICGSLVGGQGIPPARHAEALLFGNAIEAIQCRKRREAIVALVELVRALEATRGGGS